MYTLKEYLPIFIGKDLPENGWDEGMYCMDTTATKILRTNLTQGYVACFAFMLVDKGWMTILYNGRELTVHPNDLYTYSPCLPVIVTAYWRYKLSPVGGITKGLVGRLLVALRTV